MNLGYGFCLEKQKNMSVIKDTQKNFYNLNSISSSKEINSWLKHKETKQQIYDICFNNKLTSADKIMYDFKTNEKNLQYLDGKYVCKDLYNSFVTKKK